MLLKGLGIIYVDMICKKHLQIEVVVQRCSVKNVFLEISNSLWKFSLKKETLAQVFSCEFCEIS